VSAGAKKDESSTGRVWAVGFHHVTAHSLLVRFLKLINRLIFYFQLFSGRGQPRILNQQMRGHACISIKLASVSKFVYSRRVDEVF
jgi:hypothetical protein